ncbi:MAG: hypothetical protein ACKOA0_17875 [Burkholderiaceae bacterium]
MPAVGTSSDQYQNRDPALTTYRRNTAAPELRQAMAERSEDRSKAAAVERRQVEGRSSLDPSPPPAQRAAQIHTQANTSATTPMTAQTKLTGASGAGAVEPRDLVTPPKVMHALYEPPSRLRREHDDRFSMITGGTVDVRA